MIVKVKEKFEKTRHVEKNDKSEIYILGGDRNTNIRYNDRTLSKSKQRQQKKQIKRENDLA